MVILFGSPCKTVVNKRLTVGDRFGERLGEKRLGAALPRAPGNKADFTVPVIRRFSRLEHLASDRTTAVGGLIRSGTIPAEFKNRLYFSIVCPISPLSTGSSSSLPL